MENTGWGVALCNSAGHPDCREIKGGRGDLFVQQRISISALVSPVMIVSTVRPPGGPRKLVRRAGAELSSRLKLARRKSACRFPKVLRETFDMDLQNFPIHVQIGAIGSTSMNKNRSRPLSRAGGTTPSGENARVANVRYSRKWKRQRCIERSSFRERERFRIQRR